MATTSAAVSIWRGSRTTILLSNCSTIFSGHTTGEYTRSRVAEAEEVAVRTGLPIRSVHLSLGHAEDEYSAKHSLAAVKIGIW
jgi:hypothetical protein